ncbi:MAG TPA: hypothetical protein ENJ09_12250 [Planctomycetes bacterium]|nr:hypothetical protein [Planctomycetota bacterium]
MSTPSHTSRRLGPVLWVFLLSALVFSAAGRQGKLFHDDAIFLYGGIEMLRGAPVYEGMFDHKGPLGQMVCALAVGLGNLAGLDPIHAVRLVFLAIAAATSAGVFALGSSLFRSRVSGFLASAFFVTFWGYGAYAYSGNRPKMLMVLFEVGALLFATRRAWFLAGLASTLAAYTWQPTGIFYLAVLVLAFLGEERSRRGPAVLRVFLGGLLPSLAFALYALATGSGRAFLDGCFLFNLRYLENQVSFTDQLASMMRTVVYNGMGVVTLFGLIGMGLLYPWRLRVARSEGRSLLADPFAPLLLTFPFPLLWSLFDFQQYPDFFIFLPFVSISLAWIARGASESLASSLELKGAARTRFLIAPALFLFAFSAVAYRFGRKIKLPEQRAQAAEFAARYGDATLATVGVPEALVLLDRENVTRYGFIMRGIRFYIDANEPGGFAGWLDSIDAAKPDVLLLDDSYPDRLGAFAPTWERWLARYEKAPDIGSWNVYLRPGLE